MTQRTLMICDWCGYESSIWSTNFREQWGKFTVKNTTRDDDVCPACVQKVDERKSIKPAPMAGPGSGNVRMPTQGKVW